MSVNEEVLRVATRMYRPNVLRNGGSEILRESPRMYPTNQKTTSDEVVDVTKTNLN